MTVCVKTIKGKTISVKCTPENVVGHMMQQIEKTKNTKSAAASREQRKSLEERCRLRNDGTDYIAGWRNKKRQINAI